MSDIFVFDTNTLISASLLKHSISAQAINKALLLGKIALSNLTMTEFRSVIFRKKFDKYFKNDNERFEIIKKFGQNALFCSPQEPILACRDPKDNMFLPMPIA